MKKMKTRTKLAGAVTALVVAVALSAGTTFAWFTVSNRVTVNEISASVVSGAGGFQIASGHDAPSGWGSSLDVTITDGTVELDALSATVSTSVSLTKRDGRTSGVTSIDASKTAKGNYIEFKFSLRAPERSGYNQIVYLGSASEVTSDAATSPNYVKAWEDDGTGNTAVTANKYGIDNDIAINGTIAAEAANASRVSFEVSQYSGTTLSSAATVWCPNEYNVSGEQEDSASNANNTAKGFWKGNLASDYEQYLFTNASGSGLTYTDINNNFGTSYTSNSECAYKAKEYSSNVSKLSSNTTSDDSGKLVTLTPKTTTDNYVYANVTVKIWLEGTDGDCMNSIFAQTLNVALQFVNLDTQIVSP